MKRKDIHNRLMHATWLATTACCTALHDIGFDTEEIAEVMPDAMKHLGDEIVQQWYGDDERRPVLAGDAIKRGQEHAERLAENRAAGREYRVAYAMSSGEWDVVDRFTAHSDRAANAYAARHYDNDEWYVLDANGRNINGGDQT